MGISGGSCDTLGTGELRRPGAQPRALQTRSIPVRKPVPSLSKASFLLLLFPVSGPATSRPYLRFQHLKDTSEVQCKPMFQEAPHSTQMVLPTVSQKGEAIAQRPDQSLNYVHDEVK